MLRKIVLATLGVAILAGSTGPSQAVPLSATPAAQPFEAAEPTNRDRLRKHYIWCHAKYGNLYDARTNTVRPPNGRPMRCVSPYYRGGGAGGSTDWGTL